MKKTPISEMPPAAADSDSVAAAGDSAAAPSTPSPRTFTFKAIVAGLVGVLWIVIGAGMVDDIAKRTSYITSNFFPVGVTTYLLFLVLLWKALWKAFLSMNLLQLFQPVSSLQSI